MAACSSAQIFIVPHAARAGFPLEDTIFIPFINLDDAAKQLLHQL